MSRTQTLITKLIIAFLITLLCMLWSLHVGTAPISWSNIFSWLSSLFAHTTADNNLTSDQNFFILSTLRGPRTVAAFGIGAALGATGLTLQTLLKNPLAEPYTLGLSGGSALGAIAALTFNLEPATFFVPLASVMGCVLAVSLILALTWRRLHYESRSLILFGVMTSLFFGALVVTLLAFLSPDKMQAAMLWLLGEFGTSRDLWIFKLGPVIFICFALLMWRAKSFDAMELGDARMLSLGFSPRQEKLIAVILCTLMTALAVSIVGLVGFIGLASPHISRRILKSSQHQWLLPASALTGGTLLIAADNLGRILAKNSEIPAGSISALLGAPVLIALLVRRHHATIE